MQNTNRQAVPEGDFCIILRPLPRIILPESCQKLLRGVFGFFPRADRRIGKIPGQRKGNGHIAHERSRHPVIETLGIIQAVFRFPDGTTYSLTSLALITPFMDWIIKYALRMYS